jgi:hypothetical protein
MTTQLNNAVREAMTAQVAPPLLPVIIEQTAKSVFSRFSEKMKASLNGRQDRALKLALEGHVTYRYARTFSVRSEDNKHAYLVNLEKGYCTCPDFDKGNVCKHRLAAYLVEQAAKASQEIETNSPSTHEAPSPDPQPPQIEQDEEALERARKVLHARSEFLKEAIIYAVMYVEDQPIQVEILEIEGEVALVRALPKIKNGKLIPQFPFPEKLSLARVLARGLTQVYIYR